MAQPNVKTREQQEAQGACWLPLYVIGGTIADPAQVPRCFYCGYGLLDGHDDDCLYLHNIVHQKFSGKDTAIFVPKGGLRKP